MVSLKAKEVFCLIYATFLFLSGILFIGFSNVLSYKLFYHYEFIPSGSVGPFIALFILGFVHLFLTWFAVKGPTRKQDFYIILFLVVTFALLIVESAIGIWNIILWDEVDVEAVLLLSESFKTVINDDFNKNSEWNKLQSNLKCCGLNGIGDYKTIKGSFPVSCCEEQNGPNVTCFEESCRLPLGRYVKKILLTGAAISFLSCLFEMLGIFTFYSYFKSLRLDRKEKLERRMTIQRELAESGNISTFNQSPPASAPPMYTDSTSNTPISHKSSNKKSSKGSAPRSPSVHIT